MKFTSVSAARALAISVLPQPGGPESSNPFGGLSRNERNRLGILHRPFHGLAQPLLHVLQSAHVVPTDVGNLDENLADGRRLHLAQGLLKILHRDFQLRQQFVGNAALREIDLRKQPPQGDHARLAAKRFEVRADETVRDAPPGGPSRTFAAKGIPRL